MGGPWPESTNIGPSTCTAGTGGSPSAGTRNPSQSRGNNKEDGGGRVTGTGGEVTGVISNPPVGPDGCRGWAIYVRQGGASSQEAQPTMGDKVPQKEFLWAAPLKKHPKYQPGTVALCKFHQSQKSMKLLI